MSGLPWHARGRRGLELRWQLSLIIGLLLTATLLLAAWMSIRSAQDAVREEVGASLRAAEANLDVMLTLLEGRTTTEVESAIELWSQAYSESRHLCAAIERGPSAPLRCRPPTAASVVPDWFEAGVHDATPPVVRNITDGPQPLRVILFSDPHDELQEAWGEVYRQLILTALLAFVVNMSVFAVVSRTLSPLHGLVAAMDRLGRGDPPGPLPRGSAPEIRRLFRGLARLSGRLSRSREALRAMHLKHLELQEEERRMVARELHDEIGQHVAAIEIETIRIGRLDTQDASERQARLLVLRGLVAEIHRASRRVIQRLRPPAIERLGLSSALQTLFDRWREDHPQVALNAAILPDEPQIAPDSAMHLYRIVQESLTNIARHACASTVWVRLMEDEGQLLLHVVDDGRGFNPKSISAGYGLTGMRERIEAMSGILCVHAQPGLGTVVEVSLRLPPKTRIDPLCSSLPETNSLS